ncbi:hypothetical protein [Atlantibacter subterraneus]|uniref:hypothetical protein n=1 Tax=Atlantibacter subterraneus TaxID=255519 RepID=UPI002963F123|nr:hypothetical protein [Atlantibacter subterranea]MDW2743701.1 hypothetical protein [Atlantibacter subterranea]
MPRPYNKPLKDGFAKEIHTPGGVLSLVENSQLMELLRELDDDGHDVGGAMSELVALINYVVSTKMSLDDVATHLDYCAEQIKKHTR